MDKVTKSLLKLLTLIVFLLIGLYIYLYITNIRINSVKIDTRRTYSTTNEIRKNINSFINIK